LIEEENEEEFDLEPPKKKFKSPVVTIDEDFDTILMNYDIDSFIEKKKFKNNNVVNENKKIDKIEVNEQNYIKIKDPNKKYSFYKKINE
jgi:hypothetical protein